MDAIFYPSKLQVLSNSIIVVVQGDEVDGAGYSFGSDEILPMVDTRVAAIGELICITTTYHRSSGSRGAACERAVLAVLDKIVELAVADGCLMHLKGVDLRIYVPDADIADALREFDTFSVHFADTVGCFGSFIIAPMDADSLERWLDFAGGGAGDAVTEQGGGAA